MRLVYSFCGRDATGEPPKSDIVGLLSQMGAHPLRRSFLRAGSALVLPRVASLHAERTPQASLPGPLPQTVGTLLVDRENIRVASDDWGHSIERPPLAVMRPASVDDIIRIVRYANRHRVPVAMRGRGHCAYGQAQVNGGIVIDSSSLRSTRWDGDDITAEAGVLWDDLARETLTKRRIPPVMPDFLLLSVGGTLSSGGIGEMSVRLGAQVDHVKALEVVTGRGDLVSCSPSRNPELFHMTLAGMGQCALIVRASLQLVSAPAEIAVRRLVYDDADDLIQDASSLAAVETVDTIGAELTKSAAGWSLELLVGTFLAAAGRDVPALPAGLRFRGDDRLRRLSLIDYLTRRTQSVTIAAASGQPNPALILTFRSAEARTFISDVLSNSKLALGVWRIEATPLVTSCFKQPLHPLPDDVLAFTVRLQRRASAKGAPEHRAMLDVNEALVQKYVPTGAKVYPPFAPVLSAHNWQHHFGTGWSRFAAAKKNYDPRRILTPGPGIFGQP